MTMGSSRSFFELNDQEGVAILALLVGFPSVCGPMLATNLGAGNVDRSKMLTTPLMENRSGELLAIGMSGNVHFHSIPAAGPEEQRTSSSSPRSSFRVL
jgi:hypothetical protein